MFTIERRDFWIKIPRKGRNNDPFLKEKFLFWKFLPPETLWVEHKKKSRLLNMITIYVMNEGSVLDNAKRFSCL